MNLDELFRQKGELTTKIEVAQQLLGQVNRSISELLNKQRAEEVSKEQKESSG